MAEVGWRVRPFQVKGVKEHSFGRAAYMDEISTKCERKSFGKNGYEPGAKILQWFIDDCNKEGDGCHSG